MNQNIPPHQIRKYTNLHDCPTKKEQNKYIDSPVQKLDIDNIISDIIQKLNKQVYDIMNSNNDYQIRVITIEQYDTGVDLLVKSIDEQLKAYYRHSAFAHLTVSASRVPYTKDCIRYIIYEN